MKFLTTIIGILPVLCVVAPASAALRQTTTDKTGRISVSPSVGVASASNIAAARRLPTLKVTGTTTTTTTTTSSTSSLMEEVECVERYTECIKASDVCDFNFEECTTKELFYAKKPQCNSVLLQCTSAGINALFGTTSTTNLAAKNSNDEYVYPTDGSILGQFIEAGAISNRLDTSSCVKRYTSCLKKDNVCGEDFELCTTNAEFKKQKIYCESTLARCQEEGKIELFGSANTAGNPSSTSRLGVMISEGAGLAAVNAVSTCYKVADQCVLNACSANPYKCMENSSTVLINIVDAINDGRNIPPEQAEVMAESLSKANVLKYIKNACFDTIGGNKYCHMTVNGGTIPSSRDLIDEEEREDVYADIISPTIKRVGNQLTKILEKFDKKAKDTCTDTVMSCAMRSCGGGLGSACYSKVFGSTNICFTSSGLGTSSGQTTCSINASNTYNEIKLGCEAIVNTDANCQFAAASERSGTYNYAYSDNGTFGVVFPEKSTGKDPIGVVARLNASLRQNYSPAAIEQMAKECRTTAVSCIRSMCGSDFTKCYRNRTDVMTDTYATDESTFDQSMNKVGGVLDFTIVRGLCVAAVKGSPACDEHLKIQKIVKYQDGNNNTGWGDKGTVRDAWVDAVKDGYTATAVEVDRIQDGCTVASGATGTSGSGGSMSGMIGTSACNELEVRECGTMDENGCLYNTPHYVSINEYQLNMEVTTLFQEVMADLELEAQAKYNAKITEEQNMCLAANSGGIMGKKDMSSTYMWVKLKNRRVPKDYQTNGLKAGDFAASNDLYGSFCRARVTLQSDDPDIQSVLQEGQKWATTYFAVGDVFTCGSWIPQKELEAIAEKVATRKVRGANDDQQNALAEKQRRNRILATIGGVIAGGAGGAYLSNAVQSSNLLGGLIQGNRNSDQQNSRNMIAASNCTTYLRRYNAARSNWTTYRCEAKSGGCCTGMTCPVTFDNQPATARNAAQDALNAAMGMRNAASAIINQRVVTKKDGKDVYVDEAVQNFRKAKDSIDTACTNAETAVSDACQSVVADLGSLCSQVEDFGGQLANYDNNFQRQGINLLGAVLGAGAAGYGAYKLTESIQSTNLSDAEREAYETFMREVGSSIYCFIGADEAGTYGDLIEISVE